MSDDKRQAAVEFVDRTIGNIKKSLDRLHHAPHGPGSEAFQQHMAHLAAKEATLLETWETIAAMLRQAQQIKPLVDGEVLVVTAAADCHYVFCPKHGRSMGNACVICGAREE